MQKALPLFRDGGSILMNGSLASTIKGLPGRSVYAASKAALLAFARAWLVELQDRNIRVNVLSPGLIDTALLGAIQRQESTTVQVCRAGSLAVRKRSRRPLFFWLRTTPAS